MTVADMIEELKKHTPTDLVTVCFGGSEQHAPVTCVKSTYDNWVSIFYGDFESLTQKQIDGEAK